LQVIVVVVVVGVLEELSGRLVVTQGEVHHEVMVARQAVDGVEGIGVEGAHHLRLSDAVPDASVGVDIVEDHRGHYAGDDKELQVDFGPHRNRVPIGLAYLEHEGRSREERLADLPLVDSLLRGLLLLGLQRVQEPAGVELSGAAAPDLLARTNLGGMRHLLPIRALR
jgi:hypothetical protein